ncbi:TPA: lipoprotein antitoxin entericidin A [Escherichia coli]|nr:lipoprotein antitoxin entericidin A [Escherichia coli]EEQ6142391.1 lipoprotein antitoxin entericidin A [Escherichia coli]EFB5742027.1 lipoprotein antitoxin entericidin A [Escherichia coli]EFB5745547.1 lipoprotein antitoxin entericidin A [Escherichia coli]HDJ1016995.1 lipoprotein antitoxin entericidin A [Escherichia coli]
MRLWCGLQAAPSLIQVRDDETLIVLVLLASTLLTGCNTARGFGEDIKHLGNSISRAAS